MTRRGATTIPEWSVVDSPAPFRSSSTPGSQAPSRDVLVCGYGVTRCRLPGTKSKSNGIRNASTSMALIYV